MSYSSFSKQLKDSNGLEFDGTALVATANSQGYKLSEYDEFGIVLNLGTVSGTSPTLDVKVQMSVDSGTTWIDTYPGALNSETQAALAQITATKETAEFWPMWNAAGSNDQVRFVLTIGGTTPSFAITQARIVARRRARYAS